MAKIITVLISICFIWGINVYAVDESPTPTKQLSKEVGQSKAVASTIRELEGEVIAISDTRVSIRNQQGVYQLKLADGARLYCNGLLSNWRALRPVTDRAFFEARLLLNSAHQVVMLKGEYQGTEAVINGLYWQPGLQLVLLLPDTQEVTVRSVAANAIMPPGDRWRSNGQAVYVLYNFQGAIRAIFLPD